MARSCPPLLPSRPASLPSVPMFAQQPPMPMWPVWKYRGQAKPLCSGFLGHDTYQNRRHGAEIQYKQQLGRGGAGMASMMTAKSPR